MQSGHTHTVRITVKPGTGEIPCVCVTWVRSPPRGLYLTSAGWWEGGKGGGRLLCFSNSIVLQAAGESEIPEVSCVMHKRLQMIRNKTITRGGWGHDLLRPQEKEPKRVKL